MRGKPVFVGGCFFDNGNIPAYAGKTQHEGTGSTAMGTSPRMRGKLHTGAIMLAAHRNIPAYAGKTEASTLLI